MTDIDATKTTGLCTAPTYVLNEFIQFFNPSTMQERKDGSQVVQGTFQFVFKKAKTPGAAKKKSMTKEGSTMPISKPPVAKKKRQVKPRQPAKKKPISKEAEDKVFLTEETKAFLRWQFASN